MQSGGNLRLAANSFIRWSNNANSSSAGGDSIEIARDADDTLAQRRGTNAQTFRLYTTIGGTGNADFERLFIRGQTGAAFQIGTEKGGISTARALEFQTDGVTRMTIAADGSSVSFNPAVTFGQNVTIQSGRVLGVNQINLNATSTAGLALGTDSTIRWGASSSAVTPMLKRSSTTLQVRLADDTAYSVLDAQLRAQGTAPATAGATGTAGDIRYDADYIYVATATNTWKRAAIATW
jgi:hypothetical protein